jgi:archaellum component FlaF (FlaF/FlaG flagellin family)
VRYNASAVKINNATSSLLHFENKDILHKGIVVVVNAAGKGWAPGAYPTIPS